MLRLLFLLLLLANGLYFAWSQGHLQAWGWAPETPSESARLEQQLQASAVTVMPAQTLRALENSPAEAIKTRCMQSEVMTGQQADALRRKMESAGARWPAGAWKLEPYQETGSWMIYMGPYPEDMLDKKKQELKRLRVDFEPVRPRALGPGLLLASSANKASLDERLAKLNKTGVRTARILPLRPAIEGQVLRLPTYNDNLSPLIEGIKAELPDFDGQPLKPCPP